MGQFTPNIGLYIPSPGETNYDDSFASGMINLDLHDHSGGPNKGVPITSSGLANFSVTYKKLAANVADPTTGIGVNATPGLQNQLQILGILKNLFTLASVPGVGFTSMNGSTVAARTFQNSSSLTWTNPDGVAGNPSAVVNIGGLSPVAVANGGTGRTSLTANGVILGGTNPTNPVQQVVGDGIATQYLGSNGAGVIPSWQTLPAFPTQNILIATVTLTASQFRNMLATSITIVPAAGPGTVIIPYQAYGKLNYGGVDAFHDGSSVRLYYGSGSTEVGFEFKSVSFKETFSSYWYADDTRSSSTTGVSLSTWENRDLKVGANSTNFTGGNGNTVTFWVPYSIMQI